MVQSYTGDGMMMRLITKAAKEISPKLLIAVFYDILFYILAFFSLKDFYRNILEGATILQSPALANIVNNPSSSNVDAGYAVIQQFYMHMVGSLVFVILFMLVVWAVSRYLIWHIITKKKINLKQMMKFIPANFIWLFFMAIPVIMLFMPFYNHVVTYGVNSPLSMQLNILRFMFIPLFLLIFYFTNMMHAIYLKSGQMLTAYVLAFKHGWSKAYPLLVSYTGFHIAFIPVGTLLFMLGSIGIFLTVVLYFASFTWIKTFFAIELKRIK